MTESVMYRIHTLGSNTRLKYRLSVIRNKGDVHKNKIRVTLIARRLICVHLEKVNLRRLLSNRHKRFVTIFQ